MTEGRHGVLFQLPEATTGVPVQGTSVSDQDLSGVSAAGWSKAIKEREKATGYNSSRPAGGSGSVRKDLTQSALELNMKVLLTELGSKST
jgi:hypothetical protein